jgi:peptidoglycan/LPS O-acetylase OafA/YrhL
VGHGTNEKLDKDRFRRDLGGEVEAYQEVARRLGLFPRGDDSAVLDLPAGDRDASQAPAASKGFGGSMVATTLSANNVLLYLNSGYFAVAAEFKPLMHSWSMGVEEQYYLLVPVLMAGAHRLGGRRAIWLVIAMASAASFAACLILSKYNPQANFYLIWSRIWELGAGAATVLAEPRLRRLRVPGESWLSLAGLALIVLPMLLTGRDASLPGWTTLAPVAGTCLLLGFGAPSDPAVRLLSARPFVAVGLISYSAYLYHQPLFAFARIASLDEPGWPVFAGLILATFLLAWASWRWIEQPFRNRKHMPSRTALTLIAAGAALTIAAGTTLHAKQGFAAYSPTLKQDSGYDADANTSYLLRTMRNQGADLPAQGNHRLLVIGDSFARDFINAGRDSGALSYFAPITGCPNPPPPA